jgi:hypothetical protein
MQQSNRMAASPGTPGPSNPEEIGELRQQIGGACQNQTTQQMSDLRILFGVQAERRTLELVQIKDGDYVDDSFFIHLRSIHRTVRGFCKHWFSFWQFNHCDFVKVCELPRLLSKYY